MALTGRTEWKEILIVTDEEDREFVFSCVEDWPHPDWRG